MIIKSTLAFHDVTLACLRTSFHRIFKAASTSDYAKNLSDTLLNNTMQDLGSSKHLAALAETAENALPSEMARFTASAKHHRREAGIHICLSRMPLLISAINSGAPKIYMSYMVQASSAALFARIAKECAQAHEEFREGGEYADLRQKTCLAANVFDHMRPEDSNEISQRARLRKILPMVQNPVHFMLAQSSSSQARAMADALQIPTGT